MKQLSIIQQALKAPKDKVNGFGKYKYRKAEDILEAVKPLLRTNNLSLTLSDEVQAAGGKVFLATTVTLFDAAGETIAITHAFAELCTHSGMSAEQSTGAASSYARKYALCGMFAIDDSTNDPDEMKPEPEQEKAEQEKIEQQNKFNALLATISTCKTSAEVTKIWQENVPLQKNKDFVTAIKARGSELKAKEGAA